MKRTWRAILALTLVCAVALTAAAMALGSKALPLTMTDACTIGDPAAAEGLHMAARIGMEQNRLQWRMDYDPAADTTDASFRLAYSDRSGQWIFDGYGYNIQCLLADQEDDSDPICREVLRQAHASGEETVDVTGRTCLCPSAAPSGPAAETFAMSTARGMLAIPYPSRP